MQRSPHAAASTSAVLIERDPPWLIVRFPTPQRMLSWSINRPGFHEGDRVAWLQVRNADLPCGADPGDFAQERLDARGLSDAVVLMTSTPLERFRLAEADVDGVRASCLITLGLSNAERIGMRRPARSAKPVPAHALGTINMLCHVSVPLSDGAMLEASSIATQARTTAILDCAYEPIPNAGPITGTGTDCIVIACPTGGAEQRFAGMHTAIGEALGAAVLDATRAATEDWCRRNVLSPSS